MLKLISNNLHFIEKSPVKNAKKLTIAVKFYAIISNKAQIFNASYMPVVQL